MQKAVAAVECEGESLRCAAEKYGSTLHDHVSGKVEFGAKLGRDPYLSYEQKEELVSFLIKCARIGYPHTCAQIMALVQSIVTEKGIKQQFPKVGGSISNIATQTSLCMLLHHCALREQWQQI